MKPWNLLERAGIDSFRMDEDNPCLIWLERGGIAKLAEYLGEKWSPLATSVEWRGYTFREVGR